MPTIDPNRLYPQQSAARILGVSESDLKTLAEYRELPVRRFGGQLMVLGTALGIYLRRRNPHDPGFTYHPRPDTGPRRHRMGMLGMKHDYRAARAARFNERINQSREGSPHGL